MHQPDFGLLLRSIPNIGVFLTEQSNKAQADIVGLLLSSSLSNGVFLTEQSNKVQVVIVGRLNRVFQQVRNIVQPTIIFWKRRVTGE